MDATRVIRYSETADDPGAIVRAIRKANNLTLAELAARCGYSISTLSRMERGKQPLNDTRVLRNLARALNIPPHVLGLADTPPSTIPNRRPAARVGTTQTPDEEIDPMRRRTMLTGLTALAGATVLGNPHIALGAADPLRRLETSLLNPPLTGGTPSALPGLQRLTNAARLQFQHGHYTEVAAALPNLLSTALATRADSPADAAGPNGQLAEIYTLATDLLIKLGHDHLAWTTADRAVQAADASGDLLIQATTRRVWGIVLRRSGRADTAQQLVVDTGEALQSTLHHSPQHLSVYGSLLATAAYTAAVDGDRHTAHSLIGEAADAARRLGHDANHHHTAFGPTGVALYQISIARVLGDYGAAIDTARRVHPETIPLAERRARYWVDVARSFHQWGKPEPSYRALLAAEHAAPDEVRYRKPVHAIAADLLRHPTARTLPGLRAFAHRTGTPT